MKTKQELLDFYGVEIGKKYKITNADNKNRIGQTFTIKEIANRLTILLHGFLYGEPYDWAMLLSNLEDWTYEEIKPPILDDVEKEYLQKYVMDNPALKGKVDSILKDGDDFYDALVIHLNNRCYVFLPRFKKNTMYKNMKRDKQYTPQELGLEE